MNTDELIKDLKEVITLLGREGINSKKLASIELNRIIIKLLRSDSK